MAASPSKNTHESGPSGAPTRSGAVLRFLVRLLARQAAREFLHQGHEPTKTGLAKRSDPIVADNGGRIGE